VKTASFNGLRAGRTGVSGGTKAVMAAAAAASLMSVSAEAKMPTAQIGHNKIKLEVASSPEQIARGLMYRTSMPEDNGMVFIFQPPRGVKFWMAHCYISLDMLMIKDGKIIKIFASVPPQKDTPETQCPTYPSADEAPLTVSEVVEVNGGYARRHGIKEGDAVKFCLPPEKAAPAGKAEGQESGSQ
jgi:uncharacterized membrane protein (UPF0127 family)